MSYNTFGRHFKITTYGESHGPGIGVVIDGCPAGLEIDEGLITRDMLRRKPGQSHLTTSRKESEDFQITSGVLEGKSTGAPIHISIPNKGQRSKDYDHIKNIYRPSHADYTYDKKYGLRDYRGGGRSSARETACRVAAGAIAKMFLAHQGIEIIAYTAQIGPLRMKDESQNFSLDEIEASPVRCPTPSDSEKFEDFILRCKEAGDTCGGIIKCEARGLPVGLGAPIYDKLEARLAFAMLSINACIGFDIGGGFNSLQFKGSEYNDVFLSDSKGKIYTKSNNSGGVQGGISNGMPLYFRTVLKPVSSIQKTQTSVNKERENVSFSIEGRHDPCIVPRAVPIVEAMTALVLADFMLDGRMDRADLD